jgi:hypothetical protein
MMVVRCSSVCRAWAALAGWVDAPLELACTGGADAIGVVEEVADDQPR